MLSAAVLFIMTVYPCGIIDSNSGTDINASGISRFRLHREPVPYKHSATGARDVHKKLNALISAAAHRHNVDPALVKAIIMIESGYDPKAVSERGAVGLMQLMPRTADAFGVKDIFDPAHNIDGGVKYLSHLIDHFEGNLPLAVAAYNAGIEIGRAHV